MRMLLGSLLVLAAAQSVQAQQTTPSGAPAEPPRLSDDAPIVVRGLADGARVVEIDFDKVWKTCAECKRALAKLDKLARNYRDERETAGQFASGGGASCGNGPPSPLITFQRSSAEPVGGTTSRSLTAVAGGLCAARAEDQSRRTYEAVSKRFVAPEQGKLLTYMRSFLDQLAPHVREATEAERIANNASAGLTDARRTKLSATRLKRIDVTAAVIRRLNAKAFTIDLPDPAPPGPAAGGFEPIKSQRR